VVSAGQILARARAGEQVSKQALSTAQRIAALPPMIAYRLETHKAPYRVARWVAWGKPLELYERVDLALFLHRARPSKGWPDAQHLKVAFEVYLQARSAHLGTLVSNVPIEQYLAAIDALPKRRRVARQRPAAEESTTAPMVVGEDDVLRALVAARRPRRARRPAIKLRTTPLRTDAKPAASPSVDIERVQAENARLRQQQEWDQQEAERHRDFLRRENARLAARIELLERELRARSGGPPTWLKALGGVAAGAVVTEIVRKGVELFEAGEAGLLLASTGEPVMPIMPSSTITLGAPSSTGTAPPVLCETISLSVPGSLPCDADSAEPTVARGTPLIFVRIGAPAIPSREVPVAG
jgi:hypothetical protein